DRERGVVTTGPIAFNRHSERPALGLPRHFHGQQLAFQHVLAWGGAERHTHLPTVLSLCQALGGGLAGRAGADESPAKSGRGPARQQRRSGPARGFDACRLTAHLLHAGAQPRRRAARHRRPRASPAAPRPPPSPHTPRPGPPARQRNDRDQKRRPPARRGVRGPPPPPPGPGFPPPPPKRRRTPLTPTH